MSDDQVLLLRYARSRDAGAFAQLVQQYSTLVFSVARRVTGNVTTAEDVTQDCFLKLARQAASIHGSLPAWLHRVALNRSLEVIRNEATRQRHEARVSPASDPDYEPSWNQISPFVDAALAELPDDLRESLVQHFLLGRTQTQVAENLHVNQATVSRRMQEGIERVREYLKKFGVLCGAAALSTALAKNASAAVPAKLSAALAKMAIAGPAAITATAKISLFLAANAKFIAVIAAVAIVGAAVSAMLVVEEGKQSNAPVTNESLMKGLILHFTFDKTAPDGKVTDASGAGNSGKASGAGWTPNGKKGGAYQFTADGDQIEVKNNDSLNPKQITLAAWIKTSYTDDKWRRIFDKSYSYGYALSITGDWQGNKWRGLGSLEIGPGPHLNVTDIVVADGKWHHIVATFDGAEQRLYVDGKPQGEALRWEKTGQVQATKFNLVIGCNRSNFDQDDLGTSFRGLIDEPMMWNRALSPEEIAFLHESQQVEK